jgi:hypothetical protein
MEEFVIDHPRNEASGLLGMQNRSVLAALGWDAGFWIVCDEAPGEEALAALGRRDGGEWEVVRLRSRARWPGRAKRTEDSETLARAGSWVYVFGSQFGTKDGTLQPRRHFVARFNEALVTARKGRLRARVELRRRPFLLHRLVNDALRAANVEVRGATSKAHARFVAPALERGTKRGKRWAERLRPDDAPINVEGATFLPGGHLLLGLRYPVTAEGHPILVELEGIDRYFEDGGAPDPEVVAVRVVTSIGSRDAPAGVRELDSLGADVHLVTGDLDSKPEESALLAGDPRAADAPNEHWTVPLALGVDGPAELTGRRVRRFDESASVEGLALAADEIWYAHDDDRIRLEVAHGAGGPGSWNGAAAPDAT